MKTADRSSLLAALVHIRYTIDQALAWLIWRFREKDFSQLPVDQKQILRNACIESALISLRILNEFFKQEKTKGLLKASHYMGSKSPGAFLTGAENRKINDHLAHLTWKRIPDPSPAWNEELTHRALQRCHVFLDHILKHFLTASDQEHGPCSQEFAAISQYLDLMKKASARRTGASQSPVARPPLAQRTSRTS